MNLMRYSFVIGYFVTNVFLVIIFILSKWPKYWEHINYEWSHLTWLSSVNLILIGIFCLIGFMITELNSPVVLKKPIFSFIHRYIIGAMGLGFLFLALDEKFQIHEKLREKVFIPNEVGTDIPGIGAGDFLHVIIAIVGLGMTYFIYQRIKISKISLGFYGAAVFMALISVITDATSPVVRDDSQLSEAELMSSINHQFTEELFESSAIIFFAICFLNYFIVELELLIKSKEK